MNFQQLKIIRETVRQGFNLTQVAQVLFTSQPGVSRNIKELEEELGIEIFVRRGKRLLGLTEPGKELVSAVDQILANAHNLQKIAEQFSNKEIGQLSIATTHTQARYALPGLIKWFKTDYPKVHLALQQGSPSEIASLLMSGDADIGIATENLKNIPELVTFPFYAWNHAIVVRKDHPLTQEKNLRLKKLPNTPSSLITRGIPVVRPSIKLSMMPSWFRILCFLQLMRTLLRPTLSSIWVLELLHRWLIPPKKIES